MSYSSYQFDFEKLNVYQKSIAFSNTIFNLTKTFDRNLQYSLGDQFRRASLSICNNIAEGSRKTGKSKRQFYGHALDSARECVPMITIAKEQNLIDSSQFQNLRDDVVYISNMVSRLIMASK